MRSIIHLLKYKKSYWKDSGYITNLEEWLQIDIFEAKVEHLMQNKTITSMCEDKLTLIHKNVAEAFTVSG